MIEAYKKFWANYTNFSGVTSRRDYWLFVLAQFLIVMAWVLIMASTAAISGDETAIYPIFFIIGIYWLACFIPSVAIQIRRLRDAGFHWGMIFLGFIPYVGGIIVTILYCMPTAYQPQNYQTGGQYGGSGQPYPPQNGYGYAQPSQPVQPQARGQFGYAQPSQPAQPQSPGQSGYAQPSQPVQSQSPGQSGYVQPSQPVQPQASGQSGYAQSSQPVQPQSPGQSGYAQPSQPAQPQATTQAGQAQPSQPAQPQATTQAGQAQPQAAAKPEQEPVKPADSAADSAESNEDSVFL